MKTNLSVSRATAAPARPTPLGAALFAAIVTLPLGVIFLGVAGLLR
ncbi:MAG: hypothetical protein KC439_03690 [Yoonia sp.]|nr:hypothetical protein [Yoonia sp.]